MHEDVEIKKTSMQKHEIVKIWLLTVVGNRAPGTMKTGVNKPE